MNELISRKYQHIPKAEIVLFMDLTKIKEEDLNVIIAEDKIIESVLAIANFYALRGTSSQIIYEMGGKKVVSIGSREDFNAFYKACVSIRFEAVIPVNDLIRERMLRGEEGMFYVVATHSLTKEIYLSALQAISNGNHISILLISNDVAVNTKEMMSNMKLSGIDVQQIMSEDELGDMLSKEIV
jgi:hypothetical protein